MADWSHHEVTIPDSAHKLTGRVVRAFSLIHERSPTQAETRAEHEGYTGDLILEYEDGHRVRISPTGYETEGLDIS